MNKQPIVMISSYSPRLCGIATFCEEAREFIQKANPDREVLVISHTDGEGEGVFPIIDMATPGWWKPVVNRINELNPYAVHIEHEYGLYEYVDERRVGDKNDGFLDLLEAISEYPVVVEPHTIHGRLKRWEANFVYQMCRRAKVVFFKCHYQRWRLDWTFSRHGWTTPDNIMVIPHGARPDKRWGLNDIPQLRKEVGLCDLNSCVSVHLVGLIGWIQSNKRWDILLSMWEEIADEIREKTGEQWDLLAAGAMRDPRHKSDYENWKSETHILEKKGLAHYFEFIPRGDAYYKMMAVCDFIVLPSTDETQSGTLARIIALNKPYITSAPLEGLTAQTLESNGGLLFTTKKMLKEKVIRLACNKKLRMELGNNLKRYLEEVVSWEVVTQQYNEAYELARQACKTSHHVRLPQEF
jgi:glycosyltransferase involved in cell wall biosynthesis